MNNVHHVDHPWFSLTRLASRASTWVYHLNSNMFSYAHDHHPNHHDPSLADHNSENAGTVLTVGFQSQSSNNGYPFLYPIVPTAVNKELHLQASFLWCSIKKSVHFLWYDNSCWNEMTVQNEIPVLKIECNFEWGSVYSRASQKKNIWEEDAPLT